MEENKNRPVKKFKAGGVSAAVWVSKRGNMKIQSVTVDRSYKDKDGEFKNTNSLKLNDIPKAVSVLVKAYEYLVSGTNEPETEEIVI